jgi:hypothetical protein
MITLTSVKARGWTDTMVRDFLGEPDGSGPNPRYIGGPPLRLYLVERVEESEADGRWGERRATSEARRQRRKRASPG